MDGWTDGWMDKNVPLKEQNKSGNEELKNI
jgi:hypothetical protein